MNCKFCDGKGFRAFKTKGRIQETILIACEICRLDKQKKQSKRNTTKRAQTGSMRFYKDSLYTMVGTEAVRKWLIFTKYQ